MVFSVCLVNEAPKHGKHRVFVFCITTLLLRYDKWYCKWTKKFKSLDGSLPSRLCGRGMTSTPIANCQQYFSSFSLGRRHTSHTPTCSFYKYFIVRHTTFAHKLFDPGDNLQGLSKTFKMFYEKDVDSFKFYASVIKIMWSRVFSADWIFSLRVYMTGATFLADITCHHGRVLLLLLARCN